MPLINDSRAAPKAQKVKLPSLFIGSQRLFEPKPTAANFYSPPSTTGLPSPVSPTPQVSSVSGQNSVSAQQAYDPTFDYGAALANDPYLSQALGEINQQDATYLAQQVGLGQMAGAQFGAVPDLSGVNGALIGNWNQYFTPEVQGIANANTAAGTSTWAMLNQQQQEATDAYEASLAARGMVRSGALGQRQNETNLADRQARTAATQQLTNYLISLYQDYLGHLSQGNAARAAATREALQRLIDRVRTQPPTTTPPPYNPPEGFTGVPTTDPVTGFGIPADPYTPRIGSGIEALNDVNPRWISLAETNNPTTPEPYNTDYHPAGAIGNMDLPWGADMDFHDWTDSDQVYVPPGSYTQSGGEEYWQSGQGPYGYKPMW